MKSLRLALLVFTAVVSPTTFGDVVKPDQRYFRAYTEYNFEGPHIEFYDYVPDLGAYSIDNSIKSFCAIGFWAFYGATNYDDLIGTTIGVYERCYNSSVYEEISSLRYAGSPYGLNDVYYNLYEDTLLQGVEFRGNTDSPTVGPVGLSASSLVISGQSPWTFFTDVNYTSPAVCVYPEYHQEYNDIDMDYNPIYDLYEVGLPDNSIRSVAKGCYGANVVRLSPRRPSPHLGVDVKFENVH